MLSLPQPERLANRGIFSTAELYEELLSLADEAKLLKVVNNRSTGSDRTNRNYWKTRGALNRLRRLGMITFVSADNSQFVIAESVFRFGADVRSGMTRVRRSCVLSVTVRPNP